MNLNIFRFFFKRKIEKEKSIGRSMSLCFLIGIFLGVLYKYYGKQMSLIGLSPQNFKFLGTTFITLMRLIVSPLIFTSVFCAIVSINNAKKTGKLFLISLGIFVAMTAIGATISMYCVDLLKVGHKISNAQSLLNESVSVDSGGIAITIRNLEEFFMAFIPKNIIQTFLSDNFLHVIFIAVTFAFAATKLKGSAKSFSSGINSFSEILTQLSKSFNKIAPFAVFGFTFWLCGTQDFDLLKSLLKLVLVLYGVAVFLVYFVYSIFSIFVLKLNPYHFFRKIADVQLAGFLLASSSAVLPRSLEIAENDLGISKEKSRFVIPIGATLNMNGGAIYMSGCAIFVAQLFGVDLTFLQKIFLLFLSTISSIGTAPVPGSAIFLLTGVLISLKLPVEAVGVILTIDRILDMMRTTTNISGDMFSALIVSALQGDLDRKVYAGKKSRS